MKSIDVHNLFQWSICVCVCVCVCFCDIFSYIRTKILFPPHISFILCSCVEWMFVVHLLLLCRVTKIRVIFMLSPKVSLLWTCNDICLTIFFCRFLNFLEKCVSFTKFCHFFQVIKNPKMVIKNYFIIIIILLLLLLNL
jgi:hypothetical protein